MAWNKVTVLDGKNKIPAWQNGERLNLPNKLGENPTSVSVDGKTYKVLSFSVDSRDDIINITLEHPIGSPKEKGEPDGESDEVANRDKVRK